MKAKKLFAVLFSAMALLTVGCDKAENGEGEGDGVTFDITVSEISAMGATISVVPSDQTTLYYFDRVTKEAYDAYKGDDEQFMQDMVEYLREYCEESGTSLVSAISVGDDEFSYTGQLTPDTEYYAYAFVVDAHLNPGSKLTLKAFRTNEAEQSNNTFTVSVNGSTVTVTPTTQDPYFWDIVPSETYVGKSDEYIMNDLITYYAGEGYLDYYIVQGVDSYDFSGFLQSGKSYKVYVFGYEGAPTTDLFEYEFTYTGSGSGEGGSDDANTSLTEDVTLNIASVKAYYYGDWYETGTGNWEIGFFDASEREYVAAELFTQLSQTTPEGNYTITDTASDPNTAFAGDFDENGYILPTYYVKVDANDKVVAAALVSSGSFSIAKSGSNYTVSLNLADDLENKILGNYTGAIQIAEGEVTSVPANVADGAKRYAARSTLRRFSSVAFTAASPRGVRAK